MDEQVNKQTEERMSMRIIMPKPEVFEINQTAEAVANPSLVTMGHDRYVFIFDHVEYPEEGGIWVYNRGCKYPSRTLPFPAAMFACDIAKRYFLGYIRLFAKSPWMLAGLIWKKNLNEWTRTYVESANQVLRTIYYKREYYSSPVKEIRKFVTWLFFWLGVEYPFADNLGKIFATKFEHDNAYRWRVQDLAMVVTKEELIKNFPKAFHVLVEEYAKRDHEFNTEKMRAIEKIIRLAWYVPRFRGAIRHALKTVDWNQLRMDEKDRYYAFMQRDYQFFGIPFEERRKMFMAEHGFDESKYPKMLHVG